MKGRVAFGSGALHGSLRGEESDSTKVLRAETAIAAPHELQLSKLLILGEALHWRNEPLRNLAETYLAAPKEINETTLNNVKAGERFLRTNVDDN